MLTEVFLGGSPDLNKVLHPLFSRLWIQFQSSSLWNLFHSFSVLRLLSLLPKSQSLLEKVSEASEKTKSTGAHMLLIVPKCSSACVHAVWSLLWKQSPHISTLLSLKSSEDNWSRAQSLPIWGEMFGFYLLQHVHDRQRFFFCVAFNAQLRMGTTR